jgi:hypothetical protein
MGCRVMTITISVEDYRFYAHECMRWAEETDNEEHRQGFLDMAVVWIKLANDGNGAHTSDNHRDEIEIQCPSR